MDLPPAGSCVPILDIFTDFSTCSWNFGQVGDQAVSQSDDEQLKWAIPQTKFAHRGKCVNIPSLQICVYIYIERERDCMCIYIYILEFACAIRAQRRKVELEWGGNDPKWIRSHSTITNAITNTITNTITNSITTSIATRRQQRRVGFDRGMARLAQWR